MTIIVRMPFEAFLSLFFGNWRGNLKWSCSSIESQCTFLLCSSGLASFTSKFAHWESFLFWSRLLCSKSSRNCCSAGQVTATIWLGRASRGIMLPMERERSWKNTWISSINEWQDRKSESSLNKQICITLFIKDRHQWHRSSIICHPSRRKGTGKAETSIDNSKRSGTNNTHLHVLHWDYITFMHYIYTPIYTNRMERGKKN